MPVPAAPRRAAPPRRKKETPKPSDEPPAPSQEEETPVPEAKIPLPESTSNLLADAEGEKAEVPPDVDSKPAPLRNPLLPRSRTNLQSQPKDSGLVTERSTSPTLVKIWRSRRRTRGRSCSCPSKEDQPIPSLSEENLLKSLRRGRRRSRNVPGSINLNKIWRNLLMRFRTMGRLPSHLVQRWRKKIRKLLTAEPDVRRMRRTNLRNNQKRKRMKRRGGPGLPLGWRSLAVLTPSPVVLRSGNPRKVAFRRGGQVLNHRDHSNPPYTKNRNHLLNPWRGGMAIHKMTKLTP
jgi:hypothetical protein